MGYASYKQQKPHISVRLFVIPLVQNSNFLLEDLRRLNQLKDSTYQPDLNVEKVNQQKRPKPKPIRRSHTYYPSDENHNDNMKQVIEANYRQVNADIVQVVESELERIKNDPDLQHLM
ncbi:hypothetical protein [Olivibacter sp. SDN3]|uniref:hypothetical protein n=1 Tax=Olivibacter sp. SDN3 TaxID=2764720 RepID=UPI001C9E4680|nr:hypothetical protein [Olivibacter sp. SDN3]